LNAGQRSRARNPLFSNMRADPGARAAKSGGSARRVAGGTAPEKTGGYAGTPFGGTIGGD
jgi:hypothetical protein